MARQPALEPDIQELDQVLALPEGSQERPQPRSCQVCTRWTGRTGLLGAERLLPLTCVCTDRVFLRIPGSARCRAAWLRTGRYQREPLMAEHNAQQQIFALVNRTSKQSSPKARLSQGIWHSQYRLVPHLGDDHGRNRDGRAGRARIGPSCQSGDQARLCH